MVLFKEKVVVTVFYMLSNVLFHNNKPFSMGHTKSTTLHTESYKVT